MLPIRSVAGVAALEDPGCRPLEHRVTLDQEQGLLLICDLGTGGHDHLLWEVELLLKRLWRDDEGWAG